MLRRLILPIYFVSVLPMGFHWFLAYSVGFEIDVTILLTTHCKEQN